MMRFLLGASRRSVWPAMAVIWLSGTVAAAPSVIAAATVDSAKVQAWPELRHELAQAMQLATQLGEETFRWVGRELGHERIVTGAPYCAEAVHESIQPLADGNRIVNKQSTRLCRDAEGRTRQEVSSHDGRGTIYLRDPVAGESWVLDPQRKIARRSPINVSTRISSGGRGHDGALQLDASAWREHAERLRDWARQMADRARDHARSAGQGTAPVAPVPPMPPIPPVSPAAPVAPEPVVITRGEQFDASGQRRDVEVRVLKMPRDGAAAAPLPGMASFNVMAPPAVGFNAGRFAPRGPGVVTPLPARDVEGLRANGERTTWTIEAGKLGNEKPILITREVWTSPELMLTLSSRDADPRSGEVNYRLQNLRRGEPDAALMRVPADYETGRKAAPKAPAASGRG